ncbi:hypothetical protein ASD11_02125 [Aeromicrobium sp. Root495]|uniref:TetR/AcrR family transcriptional regulator n=1 Tax=Aeromicrobium sp. Root495 TaxID=1736550 RepID=UPI0006F76D7E|nr:TetR/AcrR family transcriptional regulator [Aeromicrobium sp. Root495]KQY58484.1 hypothetical protein ASD11_02125 [Aeromicrobium sp. Root495]RYJ06737.1 MAG: TetR/AcrR family transcriptional regulator [Actinomycetales bacterium]
MTSPVTGATAGRPRDPAIDARVHEAACLVFGDVGWAGFTMDRVAQRAGVGKAALYRRWPSKAALLADALASMLATAPHPVSDDVRADLVGLVRSTTSLYAGPLGGAARRLMTEAALLPELAEAWEAIRHRQVSSARDVVEHAVRGGRLGTDVSIGLLLEALLGGALMHAVLAPDDDHGAHAERLVDAVVGPLLT